MSFHNILQARIKDIVEKAGYEGTTASGSLVNKCMMHGKTKCNHWRGDVKIKVCVSSNILKRITHPLNSKLTNLVKHTTN